jgi:hypothetical protein
LPESQSQLFLIEAAAPIAPDFRLIPGNPALTGWGGTFSLIGGTRRHTALIFS